MDEPFEVKNEQERSATFVATRSTGSHTPVGIMVDVGHRASSGEGERGRKEVGLHPKGTQPQGGDHKIGRIETRDVDGVGSANEATRMEAGSGPAVGDLHLDSYRKMARSHKHNQAIAVTLLEWAGISLLLWCGAVTGFLLVMHFIVPPPPLVVHKMKLLTPVVYNCGTIEYEALYDKQSSCYPPRGSGEVRYTFEEAGQKEGSRGSVLAEGGGVRRAEWKPGKKLMGAGAAIVPCGIKAGDYIVEATATYQCDDRSWPISVTAPPMRVRILRHLVSGD